MDTVVRRLECRTDLGVVCPVDSRWGLRAMLDHTCQVDCAAFVDIHVRLSDDDSYWLCKPNVKPGFRQMLLQ